MQTKLQQLEQQLEQQQLSELLCLLSVLFTSITVNGLNTVFMYNSNVLIKLPITEKIITAMIFAPTLSFMQLYEPFFQPS